MPKTINNTTCPACKDRNHVDKACRMCRSCGCRLFWQGDEPFNHISPGEEFYMFYTGPYGPGWYSGMAVAQLLMGSLK